MPVYLRRFYANELIDAKKEEERALKKSSSSRVDPSSNMPFVNPRKR